MDIEAWKEKLEGAEHGGSCNAGVRCQICQRAYQIKVVEILKVRRPPTTYFYYVCIECQTRKLGIRW